MNRGESGFTLLEILVAVAIAAVGIAAMTRAMGSNIDVVQQIENRLLGSWVAANRLAELRMAPDWPVAGDQQRQVTLGGRQWYYNERISTTRDPDIRRVDLEVYTDPELTSNTATLFGYLARRAQPLEPVEENQSEVDDTEQPESPDDTAVQDASDDEPSQDDSDNPEPSDS